MHRTRVKICGLTRVEDVAAACDAGADAVGFICHPGSPRFVAQAELPRLARQLPAFVTPVLLFVNDRQSDVARALEAVPHALLQFHGHEPPADCATLGRPFVKAIAMTQGVDLLDCEVLFSDAHALLVDAPSPGFGGAGVVFDWRQVPPPTARRKPLVLAGGLNAGNVAAAIAAVRPWAVDVSSGVEISKGVKSQALMREFIAAVRAADAHRTFE